MKKQTIVLIVAALPLLIMATIERSSSGAPASHTGAPSEATCATVGCHDDNVLNKGTAVLSLEVGGGITNYIPGHTYPVKIKITDTNVLRFGFQLTALTNNNLMAGSFQVTDVERTQTLQNYNKLNDRNYVTYTFNGTDAIIPGMSEWWVNWTAPETNVGPVTFYVAAVSANDDMSDKGDYTYTASVSILN